MGCDDDLERVAQCQLLQMQHQEMLDSRMESRLHFVDQKQDALGLHDRLGKAQDCSLASRHVQLGVCGTGLLRGKQNPPAAPGKLRDLGISERQHVLGELDLKWCERSLLWSRLKPVHAKHFASFRRIARVIQWPEVHWSFRLAGSLAP